MSSSVTGPRAQLEALLKIINESAYAAIAEYEKFGQAPSPLATDPHPLDLQEAPNLALNKATRLLEGACDQLCATLTPPAHTIHERAQIYSWAAFKVTQEAEIAALLQGKPQGVSAEELSEKTGIEKENLTRLLRALASRSLYTELSPGVFAHSRLSANLQSPLHPGDNANLNLMFTSMPSFNLHQYLTDPKRGSTKAYKDSAFCQHTGGKDWYSLMEPHQPEATKMRDTFGRSMVGMGTSTGLLASVHHFNWKDVKTVADMGSGIGGMGTQLIQYHSHLIVDLHDLSGLMKDARVHWAKVAPQLVESGRLKFTDHDFLNQTPSPGLDVYIYRNVLLNWPDESCLVMLQNCRKVMGPNSRILIQDFILHNPDPSKNVKQEMAPEPMLRNFGKGSILKHHIDLTMMALFNTKLRTFSQLEALGAQAGLKVVDTIDFGNNGLLVLAAA